MLKGKTIAIDFDGVLNQYQGWVQGAPIPEPAPDALFFLTELASEATVIIFTCRETREVWDWLHHHQMERLVSHVTNTKPAAFCYVSRWAICFTGKFEDITGPPVSEKEQALRDSHIPPLPELPEGEWGYIGALIDGEGSICGGVNRYGRRYVRLIVTNQHSAILNEVLKLRFGGALNPMRESGQYHFQVYQWAKSGISMKPLLEKLLAGDYLKMKHLQAGLAIEFFNIARFNGRKETEYHRIQQEQIIEAIQSINKSGHYARQPILIDDRAICHQGDLVSTLEQIKTFEPHWKKDEGRLWTSRQHDGGTTG